MRRREFIVGVGAAATPAVWPLAARAEQAGVPMIGFLDTSSPEATERIVANFQSGLSSETPALLRVKTWPSSSGGGKVSLSCDSWLPILSAFKPP